MKVTIYRIFRTINGERIGRPIAISPSKEALKPWLDLQNVVLDDGTVLGYEDTESDARYVPWAEATK